VFDDISKENLMVKIKAGYNQVDRLSRGILGILVRAFQTFAGAGAGEAAASIAYYALFSLFPLLLFLVMIGSSVLEFEQVEQKVLDYTATTLPAAQDLVQRNITQVLAQRGTVGLVSIIGLLWAATSVFTILARNINKAWHNAKPRNFLQRRLMGMVIVGILTSLLLLSLFSTTIFKLLPWLDAQTSVWRESIPLYETLAWQISSRLVPWFFTFVMFFGLYHWIPNTKVRLSEAIWGALVAAIAGEITKSAFTWYLGSGLIKYHLVYGSLGTLVALMLSIYLSSLIILFGAHLSAAIAHHRQTTSRE
jgi:membrane protein